ncbi:UbiD family decarboxylase [Streptomyces sp. NBC_00988]|uniref:UbiD family decarboxylase n=1 Tax=Streptomyces sp. NBC_00988 TaxID=2903704 RepID=UPI003866F02A|nr:UbiD family decarboxylase [Streptomyces sp. NBC_00988]
MTRIKDLREYLHALDELGDLKVIKREVSADLEAAAITRLAYERGLPAPLFDRVTGAAPGFRLFGAPAGLSSVQGKPWARVALSLGLPLDLTPEQLVEKLIATCGATPVPPVAVSREAAPCKQNVLLGDEASLDRFPVPKVHQEDGGPYPGTWGVIIARTPDGRWTNWSIARIMMIDGKHMTGMVVPPQHIGQVWQEWADIGNPVPFALVQGGHPAISCVGGMPFPDAEVDESGFIGALLGEPLEVVTCETSDLQVPASAEIVIEGHLSVGRDAIEGPFGEMHGYMSADTSAQPIYSIEAITYRDDPIWPIVPEGRPVDECHTISMPGLSAAALKELRSAGLPVTMVWLPTYAANHWLVITVPQNWRERLPGIDSAEFTRRIDEILRSTRAGQMMPRAFVLDDDIDPFNDQELIWALATRVHPVKRVKVSEGWATPLHTCFTPEEKVAGRGPLVIHDGLLPAPGEGRLAHSSFAGAYPGDLQKRVLEANDWGLSQ